MDFSKHKNLPVPHQLIDECIKPGILHAGRYKIIRARIRDWYISIGLGLQQLTIDWSNDVNVTFIDYKLSPEQIKEATEWFESQEHNGLLLLNDLIRDGYRVSFVYDLKHDCVVTSLIGKTGQNPNRNLCMTTRHLTVGETLPLLLYKQFVVYDNGPWGEASAETLIG